MAVIYEYLAVIVTVLSTAECQLFNYLPNPYNQEPFARNTLLSTASRIPGSSSFPGPQPPQVLLNALKTAPPPGAAQPPTAFANLMNMFGGGPAGNRSSTFVQSNRGVTPSMPVTASMKAMVTKLANQMGHKAYYEAHGCVDPTTKLRGRFAQLAGVAMMMGCNSPQATEICDMAQVAHAGSQGANMRTMMDLMMNKDMKHMLEQCLTPSTLMSGFMNNMIHSQQRPQTGFAPPPAAASKSRAVDCSSVSQMLMMSAATEGLMTAEGMEQIGVLRNRYFKMTCLESNIIGNLPYRLCCPGHVKPPTTEEAMMLRGMSGV